MVLDAKTIILIVTVVVGAILITAVVGMLLSYAKYKSMMNNNKYTPWTTDDWKQPNFKVDAVVTYVDSKDASWKALKNKYIEKSNAQKMDKSDRWNDNRAPNTIEEIELCLLSLLKNAPFLRTIWLVTQRPQQPECLSRNRKLSRALSVGAIRMVHHDQMMAPDILPVFNSNAIECHLHNIPGLVERFVYLNDDMIITKPLDIRDVFDGLGRPVLHGSTRMMFKFPPMCKASDAYYCMQQRARNTESSLMWTFTAWHQFKTYTKTWYKDCVEHHRALLESTNSFSSRFRSSKEVWIVQLLSLYGLCRGLVSLPDPYRPNPIGRYINCLVYFSLPSVSYITSNITALCINNCNKEVNSAKMQEFFKGLKGALQQQED